MEKILTTSAGDTLSVKYHYHDIEITYDERTNEWVFELRGRERRVESLKAAKEAIDKPVPKDKKPFTKVEVWRDGGIGYGGSGVFSKVTVSSVAGVSSWGGYTEVWLTNGKYRRKENIRGLFLVSPSNDAKIQKIAELRKQVESLNSQIEKVIESLTPFTVSPEE